jgi:FMN phosphatase YigB (HAD superfamily)
MRKYEAIFFDAANTLLYPYPSVGEVYAQVARR